MKLFFRRAKTGTFLCNSFVRLEFDSCNIRTCKVLLKFSYSWSSGTTSQICERLLNIIWYITFRAGLWLTQNEITADALSVRFNIFKPIVEEALANSIRRLNPEFRIRVKLASSQEARVFNFQHQSAKLDCLWFQTRMMAMHVPLC